MFIAALFTTAKTGSHLNVHQHKMDKEDVVHIQNGILLSHKKEWNDSIAATWVDIERLSC